MTGEKVVTPARLRLGEEAQIELLVRPDCPPDAYRSVDIVLLIDASSSMVGAKLALAREASKQFVASSDLSLQRIAVVTFSVSATLQIGLSQDIEAIEAAIDGFDSGPATNIAAGLDMAWLDVLQPHLRPGALPVIVLLSDGAPNLPRGEFPPEVVAIRSANSARAGGALIYAIGLGNDVLEELLIQIAGGNNYYHFSPTPVELKAIYREIAIAVAELAIRDLRLDELLAADVDWVAGSGRPEPDAILGSADQLLWNAGLLPAEGLRFTFRVRPRRAGTYPTSKSTAVDYTDLLGRPGRFVFEQPQITIIDPPPQAASCTGGGWWTVMIHSFPDGVGVLGKGRVQGCNNAFDSGDWSDGTRYPLPTLEYELTTADGSGLIYRGSGVTGPGRVDQRVYIRSCAPPPYRLRLVTTDLGGYRLCPNRGAEQRIDRSDFRPLAFRRTERRFGFVRANGSEPISIP